MNSKIALLIIALITIIQLIMIVRYRIKIRNLLIKRKYWVDEYCKVSKKLELQKKTNRKI